MTIEINDQYFIKADKYNLTLIHVYEIEDEFGQAKEKQKVLGYFRTIEQALVFLARQQLLEEHETLTLKDYVTLLKDKIQELKTLCQP